MSISRSVCYTLLDVNRRQSDDGFFFFFAHFVIVCLHAGVKIRRALGPMAPKLACGPSELTQSGPAGPTNFEATVIPLYVQLTKDENLGP